MPYIREAQEPDSCPHCGESLIGEPIRPENLEFYSVTQYRRETALIDARTDRCVGYECPDCKGHWGAEGATS